MVIRQRRNLLLVVIALGAILIVGLTIVLSRPTEHAEETSSTEQNEQESSLDPGSINVQGIDRASIEDIRTTYTDKEERIGALIYTGGTAGAFGEWDEAASYYTAAAAEADKGSDRYKEIIYLLWSAYRIKGDEATAARYATELGEEYMAQREAEGQEQIDVGPQ